MALLVLKLAHADGVPTQELARVALEVYLRLIKGEVIDHAART